MKKIDYFSIQIRTMDSESIPNIIFLILVIGFVIYILISFYLIRRKSKKINKDRISLTLTILEKIKVDIEDEYNQYLEHEKLLLPSSDIFEEGSKLKLRKCKEFKNINFIKHIHNFFEFLSFRIEQYGVNYEVENPRYKIFDLYYNTIVTISTLATLEYSKSSTVKEEHEYLLSHYFIWLFLNRKQTILDEDDFIDEYNNLQEALSIRSSNETNYYYSEEIDQYNFDMKRFKYLQNSKMN